MTVTTSTRVRLLIQGSGRAEENAARKLVARIGFEESDCIYTKGTKDFFMVADQTCRSTSPAPENTKEIQP